jgi:hypothetical protein
MSKKMKLAWWLYVITAVVVLGFAAPALISAADTLAVIFGVALLVALGVWSWELWVSELITFVKEQLK